LSALTYFLFDWALKFERAWDIGQFIAIPNHELFMEDRVVQEMLSLDNLASFLPLLSDLPHDSTDSVQGFYEALHFLCNLLLPTSTWMIEALSTGAFFCHLSARWNHS